MINERIPSWGGVVTDMYIYPQISDNKDEYKPSDKNFCGLVCLKNWLKDR